MLAAANGQVRFHDLQRTFLILAATEPWALLHRHLLDRHRPARGWAYLADGEPYLWDWLLFHLQVFDKIRSYAVMRIALFVAKRHQRGRSWGFAQVYRSPVHSGWSA